LQNSSLKKYAQNPEPLQGQKAQKGFRASAFALLFVQVAIALGSLSERQPPALLVEKKML